MDIELEKRIQGVIIDYFTRLESIFYDYVKFLRKISAASLEIRDSNIRRRKVEMYTSFRRLSPFNANIANMPFPENIKEKLVYHMVKNINKNLSIIEDLSANMHDMCQFIRQKEKELEELTSDVNFNTNNCSLLAGSPLQPKLSTLLEYSHDGMIFTDHVNAQVKNVFCYLKEPNESISLECLEQSLSIDLQTYCRMKYIINNTKFCNRVTIL